MQIFNEHRTRFHPENVIFVDNLDTIESLDDLTCGFRTVFSLKDLKIRGIRLIDSSGKNPEEIEISVEAAKERLADHIREAHADTISISAVYKDVSIMIGINCHDWIVSVTGNEKDIDVLDEFICICSRVLDTVHNGLMTIEFRKER